MTRELALKKEIIMTHELSKCYILGMKHAMQDNTKIRLFGM